VFSKADAELEDQEKKFIGKEIVAGACSRKRAVEEGGGFKNWVVSCKRKGKVLSQELGWGSNNVITGVLQGGGCSAWKKKERGGKEENVRARVFAKTQTRREEPLANQRANPVRTPAIKTKHKKDQRGKKGTGKTSNSESGRNPHIKTGLFPREC